MTPVEFVFVTPTGLPLANTDVEIQLTRSDYSEDFIGVVMPRLIISTTDEDGKVTVALWPSDTLYYVSVFDLESDAAISYKFYVPELALGNTSVRLQDIVVDAEMSGTSYDEAALLVIQDVKANVLSARDSAIAAKTNAETAQSSAEVAQTEAANSANAAFNSETVALNQANGSGVSADAALSSETAAGLSEEAALASKNTATQQASIATTKATTATQQAVIATDKAVLTAADVVTTTARVATATTQANASSTYAAASLSSKNTSVTASLTSTEQAVISTNQATLSTNQASAALTSKDAASASATSASGSASIATDKAVIATTKATEASTSAAGAASSETAANTSKNTATTKANESSSSASAALASKNTAVSSATTALTQATNASNSATASLASSDLAEKWAIQLTDPVTGGEYSSKYWAQAAAAAVTGQLVYRGGWSASSGSYPASPALGDYYKATTNGTVGGVEYKSNDSIIYNGAGWDKIDSTDAVSSVAGRVGSVVLTKTDVGLASVDNTADTAKPVSTAQQTALNLKANLASPTFTGTVSGVTATMVGLGSVNNTSDAAKPVSTAQATAIGLKANTASPTFTGTVAGVTKAMVGLANVDNTADTLKPVSADQATAIAVKVDNLPSNRASIRPTLLLDFAKTKLLDPRIDFSRASTATVFDERGVMQTVASGVPRFDHDPATGESLGLLMEESRTNLLTYSDTFTEGVWQSSNCQVQSNAAISPEGKYTATKLVENVSGSSKAIRRSNVLVSGTQTASLFLKAGERSSITFLVLQNSVVASFHLNLLTGDSILGANGLGVSFAVKAVGNGWYKASIIFTTSGTISYSDYFDVRMSNVWPPSSTTGASYTGDGTSGIYIWRGALEAGDKATSSIETPAVFTGRSSTATFIGSNGLIQTAATGVARYQYTPSDLTIPPYLFLESAGTNLALYSDDWTGGSTFSGWNMGAGFFRSMIASDHPQRASGFQVCAYGPDSGVNSFSNSINKQTITSLGAAGTYCIYADFKALGATTTVRFLPAVVDGGGGNGVVGGVFSLNDSSEINDNFFAGDSFSSSALSILALGNNWYRCIISFVTTRAIGNMYLRGFPYIGNSPLTGDGTSGLLGTGMQLVLGDRPTSAIPTTTSQVTRAADTSTSSQVTRAADVGPMTGDNFSSWYNKAEGTLLISGTIKNTGLNYPVIISNGANVTLGIGFYIENGFLAARVRTSGGSSTIGGSREITQNEVFRAAIAYSSISSWAYNGSIQSSNIATITPTDSVSLQIGSNPASGNRFTGTIAKLAYYPKRLSNTELQGITS